LPQASSPLAKYQQFCHGLLGVKGSFKSTNEKREFPAFSSTVSGPWVASGVSPDVVESPNVSRSDTDCGVTILPTLRLRTMSNFRKNDGSMGHHYSSSAGFSADVHRLNMVKNRSSNESETFLARAMRISRLTPHSVFSMSESLRNFMRRSKK
jgi:hypothetical protein